MNQQPYIGDLRYYQDERELQRRRAKYLTACVRFEPACFYWSLLAPPSFALFEQDCAKALAMARWASDLRMSQQQPQFDPRRLRM